MLPEVQRCLKREALAGGTVVHAGAGAGCLTQGCSSNSNWHAHSSLAGWATKAKLNIASAATCPLYLPSHYIKEQCHLWAGHGEGQVSNTEKSLQLGVINPVYKLQATEMIQSHPFPYFFFFFGFTGIDAELQTWPASFGGSGTAVTWGHISMILAARSNTCWIQWKPFNGLQQALVYSLGDTACPFFPTSFKLHSIRQLKVFFNL